MWHWLRDHRRKEILETPLPERWEAILSENVVHYRHLNEEEKRELHDLLQVFVAEKHWEGCGGLELDDEIRVTIAAQACLLVLALPHDIYRNVESILVYPSTVATPERQLGVFESIRTPVAASVPIIGEAHLGGPVILVWDAVKRCARHPERGHNVVYHEFAHKLDMLDGKADGTPPLYSSEQLQQWIAVCEREYLRLRRDTEQGTKNFLDSYGAKNEAEFFAVVTEEFFDKPLSLQKQSKELYAVLRSFYRQDPASRD